MVFAKRQEIRRKELVDARQNGLVILAKMKRVQIIQIYAMDVYLLYDKVVIAQQMEHHIKNENVVVNPNMVGNFA